LEQPAIPRHAAILRHALDFRPAVDDAGELVLLHHEHPHDFEFFGGAMLKLVKLSDQSHGSILGARPLSHAFSLNQQIR